MQHRREWCLCLTSPSACHNEHHYCCHMIDSNSLILSMDPTYGQGGYIPQIGARESVRDVQWQVTVSVCDQHEVLSWFLPILVSQTASKYVSLSGNTSHLFQGHIHNRRLSQFGSCLKREVYLRMKVSFSKTHTL